MKNEISQISYISRVFVRLFIDLFAEFPFDLLAFLHTKECRCVCGGISLRSDNNGEQTP